MTCQIIATPAWHIPTRTGQNTVFPTPSSVPGIESGLNQSCVACCPWVAERTQAITPGQPLPAKEPATATPQDMGQLLGSWARKAGTQAGKTPQQPQESEVKQLLWRGAGEPLLTPKHPDHEG